MCLCVCGCVCGCVCVCVCVCTLQTQVEDPVPRTTISVELVGVMDRVTSHEVDGEMVYTPLGHMLDVLHRIFVT